MALHALDKRQTAVPCVPASHGVHLRSSVPERGRRVGLCVAVLANPRAVVAHLVVLAAWHLTLLAPLGALMTFGVRTRALLLTYRLLLALTCTLRIYLYALNGDAHRRIRTPVDAFAGVTDGRPRTLGERPRPNPHARLLPGRLPFHGRHSDERLQLQEALLPHPAYVHQVFELFGEDGWRRVYAGELEVRPPGAPTTNPSSSVIASTCGTATRRSSLGRQPIRLTVLRLGWNPRSTTPTFLDKFFKPSAATN